MKLLLFLQDRTGLWALPEWFSERLGQQFPQLDVAYRSNSDQGEAQLRDAEIAVTVSLSVKQFEAAKQLRWIHSPAAAVHELIFPELVNSDVVITNGRDVHGPVVAEQVMALLFACAKAIPQAVRLQVKHAWGKETIWNGPNRPREISGATLGLIGLGTIGRAVARHAAALGMRVIATRERPEQGSPEGVAQVFGSPQIDVVLGQSGFVVLAAPITPGTRGLMDANRLARMKPDAYLINVGRGPLIDEAALVDALRNQQIAGAALDVFDQEPLPPESPLWDLENLLITPHTAGLTEKLWERQYALLAENLKRYLNHQPLLAPVDKRRGY
jgi:phosphoglycerate dehydrogenase-like enzyme